MANITIEQKARRTKDIARSRYERHVLDGVPIEDIARQDGVQPGTVQLSVDSYKRFRDMCNLEELEAAQIDTLLSLQGKERVALEDMLGATMTVVEGGKEKTLPDYQVRRDAIKLINDKIEAVKPNGKGITVQTAVGVSGQQTQQTVTVTEGGRDFESILRKVRQVRPSELSPAPELALPEGQTLEGETGSAPMEPQNAETAT